VLLILTPLPCNDSLEPKLKGERMKRNMFTHSLLTLVILALSATMGFSAPQSNNAKEDSSNPRFTKASLRGTYAFLNNAAFVVASWGVVTFDGNGNLIGNAVGNTILPNFTSKVEPFTLTGTYTINPDGLGTIMFVGVLPDGSLSPSTFDFVVLSADKQGNIKIADELRAVRRERANGALNIAEVKRQCPKQGD
jgi:hypothetical protein